MDVCGLGASSVDGDATPSTLDDTDSVRTTSLPLVIVHGDGASNADAFGYMLSAFFESVRRLVARV